MKRYVLALGLMTSLPSLAQSVNLKETEFVQSIVKKDPIAFVPFALLDPKTGKILNPSDKIELDSAAAAIWGSKYITARDYYSEINAMENLWNSLGYSLRNPSDIEKLKEIIPDFDKLKNQAEYLNSKLREFDERIMSVKRDIDERAKEFEDKVRNATEAKYNELYDKVKDRFGEEIEVLENVKEDPNILQKPNKDLSNFVHKEWSLERGSADNFLVRSNAQLDLSGSLKKIEGLSDARIDVTVMKQINANVVYLYGRTSLNDQGIGSVKSGVEVLGNVIDFLSIEKQGKVLDIRLSKGKRQDSGSKGPWKKEIRMGQDFPFSIGPVPAVVEVGFLGQLYVDTGVSFDATKRAASVNVYPGLSSSAYANLAIGVPVAKVGIEGQVVLLNSEMALGGSAALQTSSQTGKQKVVVSIRGDHTSTTLAGRLLIFAQAKLPVVGSKRYERKFWESEGQQASGVLFDFTKEADENGFILTGAPQPEDIQELNLDNELRQFFAEANARMGDTYLPSILRNTATLEAESEVLREEMRELLSSAR